MSGTAAYYDAYGLPLTAGTAYIITVRAPATSSADYTLELLDGASSADAAPLLAFDKGGGGGPHDVDPQLYFVAPQSAVDSLRVIGNSSQDTSTYMLTARNCPVRAAITGAAEFVDDTAQLQSTNCVLQRIPFPQNPTGDSTHVAFYTVHMEAGTQRTITLSSSAFAPGFEVSGPGFDARCRLSSCGGFVRGTGTTTVAATATFQATVTGEYTLLVGASAFAGTGAYALTVGAAQPIPMPRRVAP